MFTQARNKPALKQACQQSPSIVFSNEIGGLAPVRLIRLDHIIVSTLLALMNGLCRFFTPWPFNSSIVRFFVFELSYLLAKTFRISEETCAQPFTEARRSAAAAVYIPDIENIWSKLFESVQYMFISTVRRVLLNLPNMILIALEVD